MKPYSTILAISAVLAVPFAHGAAGAEGRVPPQERPAFMTTSEVPAGVSRMVEGTSGLWVFRNSQDLGPHAQVRKIVSGTTSDLVLLEGGYRQNIRPGMVCLVEQSGRAIAALVIAESTADHAVALILELAPRAAIKAGDTAKIKTVHFN